MGIVRWGEARRQVEAYQFEISEALLSGYNLKEIHQDLVRRHNLSFAYATVRYWVWKLRKLGLWTEAVHSPTSVNPPFAVERGSSVAPAPLSPTSLPSSSGSLSSAGQVRSAPVDGFRRSHTVPEDLL